MAKKVLITGGAGFIGSTVGSALMDAGHTVIALDDLSAGRREFVEDRELYIGDMADCTLIDRVCADHPDIDVVVHCAAYIVVPDSVAHPIKYYDNNVKGTLLLVESLLRNNVTRLLFSSSASIYDVADDFTVRETSALNPSSPYARTKMHVEQMLTDICAGSDLRAISLRYFNPIGADPLLRSGLQIKEPTHALGLIINKAKRGEPFTVTGTDWPTRDGSGIRDYVHVWDLAQAHVAAVERFDTVVTGRKGDQTSRAINLGTGTGTTVFELVDAYKEVTGHDLEVVTGPPRPGDVAGAYTVSDRAEEELGWKAERDLNEGIADTLKWFDHRPTVLKDFA